MKKKEIQFNICKLIPENWLKAVFSKFHRDDLSKPEETVRFLSTSYMHYS